MSGASFGMDSGSVLSVQPEPQPPTPILCPSCQTMPNIMGLDIWEPLRTRPRKGQLPTALTCLLEQIIPHQTMSNMSGMTSSDSSSSTSTMTMMVPYLHFTPGDYLLFKAWKPTSAGTIAGACIGLVLLAIFERWLAATRSMFNAHWRKRVDRIVRTQKLQSGCTLQNSGEAIELLVKDVQGDQGGETAVPAQQQKLVVIKARTRTIPPFMAAHDIPRGFIYGLQMLVMYMMMLTVMTFQAGFFISILLGAVIGEILFGRVVTLGSGH